MFFFCAQYHSFTHPRLVSRKFVKEAKIKKSKTSSEMKMICLFKFLNNFWTVDVYPGNSFKNLIYSFVETTFVSLCAENDCHSNTKLFHFVVIRVSVH